MSDWRWQSIVLGQVEHGGHEKRVPSSSEQACRPGWGWRGFLSAEFLPQHQHHTVFFLFFFIVLFFFSFLFPPKKCGGRRHHGNETWAILWRCLSCLHWRYVQRIALHSRVLQSLLVLWPLHDGLLRVSPGDVCADGLFQCVGAAAGWDSHAQRNGGRGSPLKAPETFPVLLEAYSRRLTVRIVMFCRTLTWEWPPSPCSALWVLQFRWSSSCILSTQPASCGVLSFVVNFLVTHLK